MGDFRPKKKKPHWGTAYLYIQVIKLCLARSEWVITLIKPEVDQHVRPGQKLLAFPYCARKATSRQVDHDYMVRSLVVSVFFLSKETCAN